MKMQKIAAVCGMLAMALSVVPARAGDVKLIPGTPIEFEVTGTPPTLAKLARQKPDETVRMTIKLPADYDVSKSYPVLVFLNGGDGGFGGELNMANPFLGDAGYILVNLPLFKRNVEGETDDERLLITPLDAPYALPAFKVLLDEVRRLVPNLDESRSVLAGFSNGAFSMALMVWAGDADLLSRFSTFVLIEGGFWLASDRVDASSKIRFQPARLTGLAGKRFLVMYGDQTNPPDRIPWIADARKTVAALQQAGVAVTEMPMKNVGHDFPADEAARARAWVLGE